jgi:hypothetical protein
MLHEVIFAATWQCNVGYTAMQGRRKLRKVGGARLWGALFKKKGHLIIFFGWPPPRRQKNFGQCTILGVKKFFRTYRFSLILTNFSGNTYKFSGYIGIFHRNFNIFPEITYIEVFKRALWLKKGILMNSNELCNQKKGTCQNLGGLAPPGPPVPTPLQPCYSEKKIVADCKRLPIFSDFAI